MRNASKWIIALTVMLPTFLEIVDTSVVNVSLDHIRGSLSAGIDEATWTITSYLVSNAIIIPMTGWLSRLLGRKVYLHAFREPLHGELAASAACPGISRAWSSSASCRA